MKRKALWLVVVAATAAGCGQLMMTPRVPSTITEYEALQKSDPQRYSRSVILLHNMQRVLDNDLKAPERLASLDLVTKLGGDEADVRTQLATILADPKAPAEVQQAVLTFLLKKDQPDMAAHVLTAMGNLNKYSELHDTILAWLAKHPTGAVLSELVKLWAVEDPQSPNEARYRDVTEKITGVPWDDSLITALNSGDFTASGSALAVLLQRVPEATLRTRLMAMTPRTLSLTVLQTFVRQFDCLPGSDEEFAAMIQASRKERAQLDEAAKVASAWRTDYGYKFNVRDFSLLRGLAQDPLRTALRRAQLIQDLGTMLSTRRHAELPSGGGDDKFASRAESLSMADLWNLYLLSDLLGRPRTQMAMWVLSEGDREDRSGAWGGLVFYRAGQAEATRYPTLPQTPPDDLTFTPQPKGKRAGGEYEFGVDQRDSLARFLCHFEKVENASRTGPTPAELKDARQGNYCGLVVTLLSAESFCAHYFNPQGVVISLGVFPLRKFPAATQPQG